MEKTFNYLFNDYYDSIVNEVRGSKFQLFDAKKTKFKCCRKNATCNHKHLFSQREFMKVLFVT